MITYLKNESVVIKVNEDEKSLMIINNSSNISACIFETSLKAFADATVVKKAEGFFVEATEADYTAAKQQALDKISTF